MSNKIIELLNNQKNIKDVKLEYSLKSKILLEFSEKKIYIIHDFIEDPKIINAFEISLKIKYNILHPKNENQLLIIGEEAIFIIKDLKNFSQKEDIKKLNISHKNIISIKFSYFDNCFGVLYKDRTFIYYLLKEDNQLEEICNVRDFDEDYIDFNFCPIFSKGFEIFMIFFMTQNGEINMYGPFFPNEFSITKEYIFNMENYLIYKLGSMDNNNKNNPENTIYCLSLNVIDDLKKSIRRDNDDKDNDFIKISDKMRIFNSTFRKREIKIHNNFLINDDNEILDKDYKQIYILNKRPLTILRISDNNDIDIIMLAEEIMPLELAQSGNFTFNVENKINNYFIEFIRLNNKNEKNIDKDNLKIIQYNNEELFIQTNNSLFLMKIPYLNSLKKVAEENLKYIPSKMNRISIIKLFKWNNNEQNKKKSIKIADILIVPQFKKIFIFGILKEEKKAFGQVSFGGGSNTDISLTLKIKEKEFIKEEQKSDFTKFNNILDQKTEYDNQINNIKNKLNEKEFINSSNIKKIKLVVDESILEDNKDEFENTFNNEMNIIYKTYKELIMNNDETFKQKIDIMKNIYNNLSQSQIKQVIDENIKKITNLKNIKKGILDKKKIIEKKISDVKEKINKYELNDEELINYLNILEKYQKTISEKINGVDRNIEFMEKNIEKIFSYTNLFPNNLDLDFNLIEKDNQKKFLEFEKKIVNNSKTISNALTKI